jgi:hypothetical protein
MFCRDSRLLVSYGETDGFRKTSGTFGPTFFILPLHVPAINAGISYFPYTLLISQFRNGQDLDS